MGNYVQKLKIIFSKSGNMKFVSHLDLVRLFQRASRRSELPVALSQGFSPHLKISITKALKLGIESLCEEAVFSMSENIRPVDFLSKMNMQLPDGLKVLKAEEV